MNCFETSEDHSSMDQLFEEMMSSDSSVLDALLMNPSNDIVIPNKIPMNPIRTLLYPAGYDFPVQLKNDL
eukprot:CAMPEP_0182445868 /NCGR_PEP_ID=MMETSP1172-20130603/3834_1 /TAXON_ID=708627 /ORGANISM="Timspurckia oligopyrenoides, Strain CCMP3278" /LENGTH=69 /DNA_ID=CAMNT_0024641697 /DNA_START=59 /DNA_END=265 /DNA_ORIENTATION=-